MASSSISVFELDSLELEDSVAALGEVSHRCLIGRVLTTKQLNKQAVSTILHGAWKTRASFTISPWTDNLFLFTFDDSEDRSWVLQEAPWSIMGHLLILQPLEAGLPILEIQFTWCPFWVQIHGLPLEKMTKANGEIIGNKLGRLLRVEAHCEGLLLYRNFLRIRVEIDVTKPLPRGFNLNRGGLPPVAGSNSWISFKYEKLSDFCFDYGRIGHERKVCKFVSRDEGRASGYGPGLRTGIARSSGLLVEHHREKVDELAARIRPNLDHSSPSQSNSESVVARGDEAGEKVANSTEAGTKLGMVARSVEHAAVQGVGDVEPLGHSMDNRDILAQSSSQAGISSLAGLGDSILSQLIGPHPKGHNLTSVGAYYSGPNVSTRPPYFVTELVEGQSDLAPVPTLDNLARPISIVELSPPSMPKADLKTIMVDECMSIVFNTLTLKRKAPEVEEAFARKPKLLKGSELTNIPVAVLDIPSPTTSKTVSTKTRSSTRSETPNSVGKGRRASRVKEASSEHNGAMEAAMLGNLLSTDSAEYPSQVPSTYPYSSESEDGNWALGLGRPLTVQILRGLISTHRPKVVFLMKTKNKAGYLDRLRRRFHFPHKCYVDPLGISGGLALWWADDIHLDV
ncbi:hypothetical protein ACSBR2_029486 [Camellia fascicularis]